MNITLSPELEKFVQDQVREVGDRSADEVIAASLMQMQYDPDADLSPEELAFTAP